MTALPNFPVPCSVAIANGELPEHARIMREYRGSEARILVEHAARERRIVNEHAGRLALVTYSDPKGWLSDIVAFAKSLAEQGIETDIGWSRDDRGLICGVALY